MIVETTGGLAPQSRRHCGYLHGRSKACGRSGYAALLPRVPPEPRHVLAQVAQPASVARPRPPLLSQVRAPPPEPPVQPPARAGPKKAWEPSHEQVYGDVFGSCKLSARPRATTGPPPCLLMCSARAHSYHSRAAADTPPAAARCLRYRSRRQPQRPRSGQAQAVAPASSTSAGVLRLSQWPRARAAAATPAAACRQPGIPAV